MITGVLRKDVKDLKELKRTLPYPLRYTKAAALDVVDAISHDATVNKEFWQVTGTVKVYGNESRISLELTEADEGHSDLCIQMLSPAPGLSETGQERALRFLGDSVAQLLENTLMESDAEKSARYERSEV